MSKESLSSRRVAAALVVVLVALAGLMAGAVSQPAAAYAATSDSSLTVTDPSKPKAATTPAKQTIEEKLANVNISARTKIQNIGWQKKVKSGKTMGTKTKKGLRKFKVKLTGLNGVSGSIRYRSFVPGSGWTKLAKDGKVSGSSKRAITAVKVYLKGKVSKYYNVYYRTYFKGYGWLGWTKNNHVAGTKSNFGYISAMQIKLVKKGKAFSGDTTKPYVKNRWQAIERKYLKNKDVRQILEVKYRGGSSATVVLRVKKGAKWTTAVSCRGYVGSRGVGPTREGLSRTPSGDFGITDAFGIKDDPGAKLNYVKVTSSMYWCSDRSYYNELIDINDSPHNCSGEHLIDYSPHYNYGLFFDYNTNPVRYGKGSAFFVHCTGGDSSTAGCIAVSQSNMKKIIRKVSDGARICIYSM